MSSFGLLNVAQTFQILIDEVLKGIPFAFANIDDVLIVSRNSKEHQNHVQIFKLKNNAHKCDFAVSKLNFLGYVLDKHKIIPVPLRLINY